MTRPNYFCVPLLPPSPPAPHTRLTRQPPDKRPKLLLPIRPEPAQEPLDPARALGALGPGEARRALLDLVRGEVVCDGRVKAGLEECEKEVENVDGEGVADNVPLQKISAGQERDLTLADRVLLRDR